MPIRQEYAIGMSAGIEVETTEVLAGDAQHSLSPSTYQTTHDASIESDLRYLPNIGSVPMDGTLLIRNSSLRRMQGGSRVTIGTEIITTPIDLETDTPDAMVKELTRWLSEYGEPCMSERAGIHIHIGLGATNLEMLKSAIRWGRHLEALFFHLAGNGYEFRGIKNNAAYCRPITRNGPPFLASGSRSYQKCFDINDMLEAVSTKQFWYLYGATNTGNISRYVPQRYIWLNFYSLLAHRTLEFRTWNITHNAAYLLAEIELCHLFTQAVIKSIPAPETERSAFDITSIGREGIQQDLDNIANMWGMSEKTHKILSLIVKRTPLMQLTDEPTRSHLSYNIPWDGSYSYTPKVVSSAVEPHVVTIHSLRGEPERN